MFKRMIKGIFWPVLWLVSLTYGTTDYYVPEILRWCAGTLMVSYLYVIPSRFPFWTFGETMVVKINLRVWVVAALFAVIWGRIVPAEAALILITSVACSTMLGYRKDV